MSHLRTVLVAASLVFASAAVAADYSDLYVIPVAAHADGAFGTAWTSDIVVHNLQLVPITVEIALVESGHPTASDVAAVSVGNEAVVHLAAGETRVIADVLASMQRATSGALIVGGSMPFAITSRTRAHRSDGSTLGQTVQPVAMSGGADAIADFAIVPGLQQLPGQRANVGLFVAASHAPFVAEIELIASDGTTTDSQLVAFESAGFAHRQISVDAGADVAAALVRIREGDGVVVPYASVIDNVTAEALFVAADAASNHGSAAQAMMSALVHTDR